MSALSNSTRTGSTRSFDSPGTSDLRQNLPLSSLQTDGAPKTRTIAIAVKAHERLRLDAFDYAFNHLIEQRNCKVVVISCLSRLKDESKGRLRKAVMYSKNPFADLSTLLQDTSCRNFRSNFMVTKELNMVGVDRIIDVEMFGGISKKKLEAAIDEQILTLNYFLKKFQSQLEKKGIQLDIRVPTGPKSADILVQACRAIRPHWLVLDFRFSGAQKNIQEALDCNLVLMKKNPKKGPLVLKLADSYLGPAGQIQNDLLYEEDPGLLMEEGPCSPSQGWSTPSSRYNGTNGTAPTMISNQESFGMQNTTQTSSKNPKMYSCITCMCFSSAAEREVVDRDAGGPTEKQTVLYGTTAPGNKATYLGKVGNLSMTSDLSIVPSRMTSLEAGPTGTFFKLGGGSGSTKSSNRSTRLIEQQLKAQMAISPVEEDGHLQLQL